MFTFGAYHFIYTPSTPALTKYFEIFLAPRKMLIFPKELRKTALINLFPLENVSEVSYRLRHF